MPVSFSFSKVSHFTKRHFLFYLLYLGDTLYMLIRQVGQSLDTMREQDERTGQADGGQGEGVWCMRVGLWASCHRRYWRREFKCVGSS